VTLPLLCGGKCRIIDETGSDWKKDLTGKGINPEKGSKELR